MLNTTLASWWQDWLRCPERLAAEPCCLGQLRLPVTLSMGLAEASELVDLADRRLYRAKSAGRDALIDSDDVLEDPLVVAGA